MTFYIGQKVVCIDDSKNISWPPPNLKIGNIYTVTKFEPSLICNMQGLWVYEAKASSPNGFNAARFRPLVDKKTDISIFKKMLNTDKIHENS